MAPARRIGAVVLVGLAALAAGFGASRSLTGDDPAPVRPIDLDRRDDSVPTTTTTIGPADRVPPATVVVPPTEPPLPPAPPPPPPSGDDDGPDDDDDGPDDDPDVDIDDDDDD